MASLIFAMIHNEMVPDEFYMLRAFELAKIGMGHVSPNPMVGCVVVQDQKIVGEGWHQKYGEAHAEVHAVNAVPDKSMLKGAVVYVNLEPCAHEGKTPPCAHMLARHGVGRVVIANVDPNSLVAGKGIRLLKESGAEVTVGVLEKEGLSLNRRFFTFLKHQRPFVILKWAQTSDGFIARQNFDSKWISNVHSRQLVHRWRAEEDALLVGYNTAACDNPRLTVRDWTGKAPVRVVVDYRLGLPLSLHLFDGAIPTLCYNTVKDESKPNLEYVRIGQPSAPGEILNDLYNRGIQSLIVEGGAHTINNFIGTGLWDEARVFTSPQNFESGIPAPVLGGGPIKTECIEGDVLKVYGNGL